MTDAGQSERALDGIVLDLDDTLLDTTRLLLPAADRRAVTALRDGGLPLSEAAALAAIKEIRRAGGLGEFRLLAERHGVAHERALVAERTFFVYDLPPLQLDPRVERALDELEALAPLALMTYGVPAMQRTKTRALGITARFAESVFVDHDRGENKSERLAELLARTGWDSARVVVVGDSLGSDIRAACDNGCRGIWIDAGGERSGDRVPPAITPWRTVHHVAEVPALLTA